MIEDPTDPGPEVAPVAPPPLEGPLTGILRPHSPKEETTGECALCLARGAAPCPNCIGQRRAASRPWTVSDLILARPDSLVDATLVIALFGGPPGSPPVFKHLVLTADDVAACGCTPSHLQLSMLEAAPTVRTALDDSEG